MATVTAAQNKLAEITNKIGDGIKSEPSQWDEKTLNAYNDEVTELYEKTVKEHGDTSKWTADQKKEYDEKVDAIKDKYAEKTSVAIDKAAWTKEQTKEYNDAVAEYNEAVKAAKEAMANLASAKTSYSQARLSLDSAKEKYYEKVIEEQNQINEDNSQVGINDPVDSQTNSGNPVIGGIEVTEEGAFITDNVNNQNNNNEQIVNDDSVQNNEGIQIELPSQASDGEQSVPEQKTENVPQEVIVNDDGEPKNYGVPIIDVGSGSSGAIANDDIKF